MTQRIFDVKNEKDMQDLWDILPEDVNAIRTENGLVFILFNDNTCTNIPSELFKIRWYGGKAKITRPIQEATEADVGKLCVFWDNEYNPNAKIVGCLCTILPFNNFKYTARGGLNYRHCRRLTKTEIEGLC